MKRKMRTFQKISALATALVLCLSLSACGKLGTVYTPSYSSSSQSADGGVTNTESAEQYLDGLAADYGYENAMSELTAVYEAQVSGDGYYRFRQNYKGIPVYGRGIVLAADGDGSVMSVSGNPLDVRGDVPLTPTITQEQVESAVADYIPDALGIAPSGLSVGTLSADDLAIYCREDTGDCALCYAVDAAFSDDSGFYYYELLVDACGAQVLHDESLLYSAGAVCGSLKGQNIIHENVEYSAGTDGTYQLIDQKRGITAYLAKNEHNGTFLAWLFKTWDVNDAGDREIVGWSTGETPDEYAVDAFSNTQTAYAYFDTVLGCVSPLGDGTGKVAVVTGLGTIFDSGTAECILDNAESANSDKDQNMTILCFGDPYQNDECLSSDLDIVAHEYTHAVERNASGMAYEKESGIIMEGLSDIFGELVQAWYNGGAPDWANRIRDMASPEDENLPAGTDSDNWLDPSRWDTESAGQRSRIIHRDSTVVSHAACLMCADDVSLDGEPLDDTELAELWYRAMLTLPHDCTLSQLRTYAETAALCMDLTEQQRARVSTAFDAVGIGDGEVSGIELSENPEIRVYGADYDESMDGNPVYGGYTIEVWKAGYLHDADIDLDRRGQKMLEEPFAVYEVTEALPFTLPLESGRYYLRFTDSRDAGRRYLCTVSLSANCEQSLLELYTNFGGGTDSSYEAYLQILNSGAWQEHSSSFAGDNSERFCIYDLDADGVDELVIIAGNSMADYSCVVYSYQDREAVYIGTVPCGMVSPMGTARGGLLLYEYSGGLVAETRLDITDGKLAETASDVYDSEAGERSSFGDSWLPLETFSIGDAAVLENWDPAEHALQKDDDAIPADGGENDSFAVDCLDGRITLIFPSSWAGHYKIEENETRFSVYNLENFEADENLGLLFSVSLSDLQNEQELEACGYPDARSVGQWSGGLVVVMMPSDICFDPEDGALTDAYMSMSGDVNGVLSSVRINE